MLTSLPTIPPSCPFSIRLLSHNSTPTIPTASPPTRTVSHYLIREHDPYGEYPNIYAKVIKITSPLTASVIVLSDTGCGTQVRNAEFEEADVSTGPEWWDIGTFLDFTLNRGHGEGSGNTRGAPSKAGKAPYLIITTHCHFDHILGIAHLPPTCGCGRVGGMCCSHCQQSQTDWEYWSAHRSADAESDFARRNNAALLSPSPPSRSPTRRHRRLLPRSTVLSSSAAPQFITPRDTLRVHSLCQSLDLPLPKYMIGIWATHPQSVIYPYTHPFRRGGPGHPDSPSLGTTLIPTGITILHTPGHTPDSLSWYDEDTRTISVGDSFYERESRETKQASWGPEPPMPTIFTKESDLAAWWRSLQVLRAFVMEKQREGSEDTIPDDESREVLTKKSEGEGDWTSVTADNETISYLNIFRDRTTTSAEALRSSPQIRRKRVHIMLSAAHVTTNAPAQPAIDGIKHFMARILRDEVPFKHVEDRRGEATGLWDDSLIKGGDETEFGGEGGGERDHGEERKDADDEYYRRKGRWSVMAPIRVVEEGRKGIPREEWS